MKKIIKNFLLVSLLFLFVASIFALFNPQSFQTEEEISFSQLAEQIKQNKIEKITITGNEITAFDQNGEKIFSRKEPDISLFKALEDYGISKAQIQQIEVTIEKETDGALSWLLPMLGLFLPILLFAAFFFMIFKQAKTGMGQTFGFLKSPAKLFGDGKGKQKGPKVTFQDIADLEEAKQELLEVVDFLKNPKKYLKMGAQIPRGVLLVGAPGTGKTMLARAVANESKVPFFAMSGSAFIELFVGVGSSRVRHLFAEAKKNSPSIIFIDEVESIGKVRMPGIGGGHDEREQTLNQILAEMDGFERDTGVIVLAATNRPEYLDPALLRPGRFDRRIVLDLPDVKGREAILKIHCRDKPLAMNANLKEVAERTPGFSGADLANLVNEAAILAARRDKAQIYQMELLESIEKVLLGPERKSHLLTGKEKEISAFHEAGHALVSTSLPAAETVRKVSIVARGMAAGYTLALPKTEKRLKTKSEFLADLAVLLGGYAAEKLMFKEISTGASNDLEKASLLARALVTKYGMSNLGPISFGRRESLPFLSWEQETERNYSEKVASAIDKETERFIKEAEKKAGQILKQKKAALKKIADVLIEKETIEKEEFEELIKGKIKVKAKAKKPKKSPSRKKK